MIEEEGDEGYLSELKSCELCEWRCGVDRLNGELGVCMMEKPCVTSRTLHPPPPKSYTVFMSGCNFRCLNCQNWSIAHRTGDESSSRYIEPDVLAEEAVSKLNSRRGKKMGADRIFFSGGSPTPSLPYIEKIVEEARDIDEYVKVNYDTNGFLTEKSLQRVIDFTTSITFDIKAFYDDTHRALNGAPVEPVLRNAEYVLENAKEKLWEFRFLLIPGINEGDVKPLAEFLKDIDEGAELNFLAFRPNFVLENYPGASTESLKDAVKTAEEAGLKNVSWSGRAGIEGSSVDLSEENYRHEGAKSAGGIAKKNGCITHPRDCGTCKDLKDCTIKSYRPSRRS